jgi:hypothetical protein
MRCAVRVGVAGLVCLAAVCYGYGGFEVTSGFVGFDSLNRKLSLLNQTPIPEDSFAGGRGTINYKAPLWWYGGHGGSQVGVATVGGYGAVALRANHADSLGSEMAAIRAGLEVGYPYMPEDWFWLRGCLELGGAGCAIYAHSVENGVVLGNFSGRVKRWYSSWIISAAPGVEVMGMLPTLPGSFAGLFVKGSYFLPLTRPSWFGDQPPPVFGLRGFTVQVGLRFGRSFHRVDEFEEEQYEP